MGNTGQKKEKNLSLDFTGPFEFEVFIHSEEDQSRQSPHVLNNTWCILQFVHKKSAFVVSKDGIELKTISLDDGFEVLNEHPGDFIFTIRFCTDNESFRRWKIRCQSINEYQKWTKYLKKNLRHEWRDNKSCQVSLT